MLNGGKLGTNVKKPLKGTKMESSEDLGRQEIEEGKSSHLSEFSIRSPHIQKKRMDFGHGTHNEYVWIYTKK